ncbi:MAG: efflux RND transporter periplasmic adaptor subunit [Candidatus Tectomicrobia bacterium]|nr:efflux RND transporter periplasmic adaptor subunit [Candidatus Tectomicrobia bacterium]
MKEHQSFSTILGMFGFIILLSLYGCEWGKGGQGEVKASEPPTNRPATGGGQPRERVEIPVRVDEVKQGTVNLYLLANSTLEADHAVDVLSKASGTVIELYVEEGDQVQEGDPLAKLDDREIDLKLRQAAIKLKETRRAYEVLARLDQREAQLKLKQAEERLKETRRIYEVVTKQEEKEARLRLQSAEAKLKDADDGFIRASQMFQQKIISQKDFDQARLLKETTMSQYEEAKLKLESTTTDTAKYQYETALAQYEEARIRVERSSFDEALFQLEMAQAQYDEMKLKKEDTLIRSPLSGIVAERMIQIGEMVNQNKKTFSIVTPIPLQAKIYLPQRDLGKVTIGREARLRVESAPGREFLGAVKRISPVVDPKSGTAKVTIELQDSQGVLRPGLFASVSIVTESHPNTLVIPKRALISESTEQSVFIVEDGKALKKKVKVGLTEGDQVEIVSNLTEREKVVTVGQEGLQNGSRVRIIGEGSSEPGVARVDSSSRPLTPSALLNLSSDEVKKGMERLMRSSQIREEYERKLQEDPALGTNPEKEKTFYIEARMKRVKEGLERMMNIGWVKEEYDRQLKADPTFATDFMKEEQFFEEVRGQRIQSGMEQLLKNPRAKEAYDKRLKEDPELATDIDKQGEFLQRVISAARQRAANQ